jgi:hypothetical protein
LRVADTEVGSLSFDWDGDADRLRISDFKGELYEGSITGSASIPFHSTVAGAAKVTFKDVQSEPLAKDWPSLPLQLEGSVSGSLDGALPAVKANEPRHGTMNLDVQAPKLRVQGLPAERLTGKIGYRDGVVDYQLDGETLGGKFHLDGKVPPAPDEKKEPAKPDQAFEGAFRVEGALLSRLSDALKIPRLAPLRGQVDATLNYRVDGSTLVPTGTGRLTVTRLRWGMTDVADNLRGELRLLSGAVRLENLDGDVAGGSLSGRVQWNYKQPERSFFVLALGRADSAKVLAPFPEVKGGIEALLDVQLRGSLGREWSGTGLVGFATGKASGLTLTDVRMPLEWRLAPKTGNGQVVLRDASAHAASGRIVGQATLDWGLNNRVDGSLRFNDVRLRSLLTELGQTRETGIGRVSGRFTFKGEDVHSIEDLSGDLAASFTQTQASGLPVLRQLTPYLTPGESLTFREGDLRARLSHGIVRVQRLALTSNAALVFAEGNVNLSGKLDLDVKANTRQLAVNPAFLRLFGLRIPAVGPIPVALLLEAGSYLSNRLVNLHVTGTIREPNVQVNATALASEEAVRFFLNRASLPLP